jgi:phenylpropionate dioxygenase-like ring-hydroxylating dioxygenase large terminal subunit
VQAPPSLDRTPAESNTPVAAEEGASRKEQFIFTKQWYPVAVVEFLDQRKPHPIQLMGKDLVAWLDTTSGKWNVFEDACPHRLAPLSEGRIEPDGTLLCTYHAWRFDSSGACTSIPQAKKEKEAELCALPKACAIQHPVQEAQGLLWVWGEPGAPGSDAAIEASLKVPSLIPELEDPATKDRAKRLTWSIRDMPYGWDYFLENVLDPAHVSVSHHGITGNRCFTQPEMCKLLHLHTYHPCTPLHSCAFPSPSASDPSPSASDEAHS